MREFPGAWLPVARDRYVAAMVQRMVGYIYIPRSDNSTSVTFPNYGLPYLIVPEVVSYTKLDSPLFAHLVFFSTCTLANDNFNANARQFRIQLFRNLFIADKLSARMF